MTDLRRTASSQRASQKLFQTTSSSIEILDDYAQSSNSQKPNSSDDSFFKFHNLVQKRHEAILKEIDSAAHVLNAQNATKLSFAHWSTVFSFFSAKEVLRCAQVCKFFERLGYDDGIWKSLWAKSDFIPKTEILESNEVCWRVKYRFFSGTVVKSGNVQFDLGSGLIMRTWRSSWCLLHGSGVSFIDTSDKTSDQLEEIKNRSKFNLRHVTVKFHPMASFNFNQASISFDGALFGAGKFQIVLRTSKGECRFAMSTESERAEWVKEFEVLTRAFAQEVKRFRHFSYQNAVAQGAKVHQSSRSDEVQSG
jgi:hypothetical protein